MAQLTKTSGSDIFRQERGWGYEVWIENFPLYCGKLLHLYKGKRCSLHYHMKKIETMWLQSGKVEIMFVDPETGKDYNVFLDPGDKILIPRGQVHQIYAHEESNLIEFSTEHYEDDSYRVRKGD